MDHKDRSQRRFEFYKEIKAKVEIHLGKPAAQIGNYQKIYASEVQKMQGKSVSNVFFF